MIIINTLNYANLLFHIKRDFTTRDSEKMFINEKHSYNASHNIEGQGQRKISFLNYNYV